MKKNKHYEEPVVNEIDILVEQSFAASFEGSDLESDDLSEELLIF